MKMNKYQFISFTYNVVVHSNDITYIKRGRIGMDPVGYGAIMMTFTCIQVTERTGFIPPYDY